MKNSYAGGGTLMCFIFAGLFMTAGIVASFRCVGGVFSEAALFVRNVSFEDVTFLPGLRRAMLSDLVFCVSVAVFATSFPVSVVPGGFIALESFFMGVSLGLAARCRIFSEAMGICFAVFVSNFLVLPLEILLFVSSLSFSRRMARSSYSDRKGELSRFLFKVLVFFLLMCVAQCIQIGMGILVLGTR